MLSHLHVENYILIDSLETGFPEGLVIITGQTGAGKSILLGALSLVLGAKADAGAIGPHGETCVVEATFDVEDDDLIRGILADNDLEWDGGHLVIRRVVHRSGRSRAFVGDIPVAQPVLTALSARLIDIHSQHQTLLLSDGTFQLGLLDHYAGAAGLTAECRAAWQQLSARRKELAALEEQIARIAAERDYDEARYRQLDEAHLREGEIEELEAEQRRLANAEEIRSSLYSVQEIFLPTEEADRAGVDALLKETGRHLEKAARFVPALAPLVARVASARVELDDVRAEVEAAAARTEVAPDRLQAVEDRLGLLYDLLQRHGCADLPALIARRDALSATLHDASSLEERRAALAAETTALAAAVDGLAARLHAARTAAAAPFAAAVTGSLRFLELEQAVFEVAIAEAPVGPSGADSVRFRFSATGRDPVDLARCASGGELSRIMLSLKAMMARYTAMPTMVFDEIDTGVSGSAADRMGSMICGMGADMQVFAITHLPQVAAKGSAHYLVEKHGDITAIRRLSGEERVMEVARMLSGAEITPAAVANARALLS